MNSVIFFRITVWLPMFLIKCLLSYIWVIHSFSGTLPPCATRTVRICREKTWKRVDRFSCHSHDDGHSRAMRSITFPSRSLPAQPGTRDKDFLDGSCTFMQSSPGSQPLRKKMYIIYWTGLLQNLAVIASSRHKRDEAIPHQKGQY